MADYNTAFMPVKDTTFNNWNRAGSDECNIKKNTSTSEKPLKYMENNIMKQTSTELIYGSSTAHINTDMAFPQPTSQRHIHQLKPDPFSFKAFEGNGDFIGSDIQIDTNSEIRATQSRVSKSCNLPGVNIDRFDFIDPAIQDPQNVVPQWINGGTSTRNDFRNMCNKNN